MAQRDVDDQQIFGELRDMVLISKNRLEQLERAACGRDEDFMAAARICQDVEVELLSEAARMKPDMAREAMANAAGAAMCAKRLIEIVEYEPNDGSGEHG